MKARNWCGVLASLLLAAVAGCGSSDPPHGSPLLLNVYWEVATVASSGSSGIDLTAVWTKGVDAGDVLPVVSPGPRRFDLIFDKVLDGSKIEDTIDGGGGQVSKTMNLPVTVSWPGSDAAPDGGMATPYKLSVWYNSIPLSLPNHVEASGTSYVFAQETPSFPAGTTLNIHIDKDAITSAYGEVMTGPEDIQVTTEPFTVTPVSPSGTVAVNYWALLQFNTRPADPQTILPPFIHVSAGGKSLAFKLAAEPLDPRLVYLQPAAGQIWPSGATVDVTIDPGLPDLFGSTLGSPAHVTFMPCIPGDKGMGCVQPDAGTPPDAGAPDAGTGTDTGEGEDEDAHADAPATTPDGGDVDAISGED